MAKPVKELLKKVSSVSGAVAALLSASNAAGSSSSDPETNKRMQDALEALKRATGPDADQVRFHAGGQLDPQTQEILLAGHSSHSSHASHSSGSYIRGSGSSGSSGSTYRPTYTPTYPPSYSTPSYSTPSSASSSTPASPPSSTTAPPAPTTNLAYKSGVRLAGSIIQKGSWGVQLLLKDLTRIQIPRRKLRAEDITLLELPPPKDPAAPDVPSMVYLQLKDGTNCTGRVSAADGEKVTLIADDQTSHAFQRAQMDPDTFIALQGLTPDVPPPLAPSPSPPRAIAVVQSPPAQAASVVIGQQVLLKLKSGSKMLVTLLSKTDDEISFRTMDGHEYRLPASRLSAETLAALRMPVPASDATSSPAPKRKK